jgi:GNAT superfamily N-acetyltransferase
VGWSWARLEWATSVDGTAEFGAFVRPALRRGGLGTALYDAGLEHLRAVGAASLESWASDEAGARFLGARRFRPMRTLRGLRLDLSTADLTAYAPLRAVKEAEGYSVVAFGSVAHRTRELHALDAASIADVPATHAEDDFRYEDWIEETLKHPQLSREGSFVVLAADEPVAYALLHVDPVSRLAVNEMTGTRADVRRRGLARLAKLATISWAQENGFIAILTSTDCENAAMLGLNERLGYRQITTETQYLLDDLR